ncbi:MAG: DUF1343 domain-containing protein [Chloroherpetonaceae bacterium]
MKANTKRHGGYLFALMWVTLTHLGTSSAQLRTGLDVLVQSDFAPLKHKRLALIANATSRDAMGKSSLALFQKNQLDLRIIFAPEHGFQILDEAGRKISDDTLSNGLKVISLYGKTKQPTPDMLADIDAIVFDIQDIGTRCYTYISTMFLAMQTAEQCGKEFIILDRPNPIAPIEADGMMLEINFISFVGQVHVPFIHALTIGEIALWIQQEVMPALKLNVVKMENYSRHKFADEDSTWKSRFVPPSPNIQSVEAMILYPTTVLLEGTNVSEGRGTDLPFEQVGAPFIDGKKLKDALGTQQGVEVQAVTFTPKSQKGRSTSPKFEGKACGGVRFHITAREKVKPFELAVSLLTALHKLYPKQVVWNKDFFDKLAGTSRLREMIQQGKTPDVILNAARESRVGFEQKSRAILLYAQ